MKDTSSRLLTVFEAEAMTGRKAATWRRDIRTRRIAYVRLGRQVRIPLAAIMELIQKGYRPSHADIHTEEESY
jgi:excisionase family DNA binding protein